MVLRNRSISIHIYTVLDISHWILHELDWKRIWQSSVSRTPRYTARGNAICSLLLNWPHVCIVSRSSGCRSRLFFPGKPQITGLWWVQVEHSYMLYSYYIQLFKTPTLRSSISEKKKKERKEKISIDRSSSRIDRFPFDCNRFELLTLDILYFFTKHESIDCPW